MATQKDTLEMLVNRTELLYWLKVNDIPIEEFPGGYFVDEWKVNIQEDTITSVERRMDEPTEL